MKSTVRITKKKKAIELLMRYDYYMRYLVIYIYLYKIRPDAN